MINSLTEKIKLLLGSIHKLRVTSNMRIFGTTKGSAKDNGLIFFNKMIQHHESEEKYRDTQLMKVPKSGW